MKKFKKIFALAIACVMMMAMGMTAFAGTIEVKDVIEGETYTAYKILNYTANEDKSAVSYYLTAAEYEANEDGTAKDGGQSLQRRTTRTWSRSGDVLSRHHAIGLPWQQQ